MPADARGRQRDAAPTAVAGTSRPSWCSSAVRTRCLGGRTDPTAAVDIDASRSAAGWPSIAVAEPLNAARGGCCDFRAVRAEPDRDGRRPRAHRRAPSAGLDGCHGRRSNDRTPASTAADRWLRRVRRGAERLCPLRLADARPVHRRGPRSTWASRSAMTTAIAAFSTISRVVLRAVRPRPDNRRGLLHRPPAPLGGPPPGARTARPARGAAATTCAAPTPANGGRGEILPPS